MKNALYVVVFFARGTTDNLVTNFDDYSSAKQFWNDFKVEDDFYAGMFIYCVSGFTIKIDSFSRISS